MTWQGRYINLDRASERRARVEEQIAAHRKLGLGVERVDADTDECDHDKTKEKREDDLQHSVGLHDAMLRLPSP